MEIPMFNAPSAIDFCPFASALGEKYGFNYRDMAGKYSKEAGIEREEAKRIWLEKNGYSDKAYVLDKPEGSQADWPGDSEEMRLRIEINKAMASDGFNPFELRPYQDVWHWLLDNDFYDLQRGGYNTLSFWSLEDDKTPDYVKKFLLAVREEVKDNPAFDGKSVTFYIDW